MKLGRRIVVLCGMGIGGLAAAPLSAAQVPPVSDAARAVGFVDVRSVVPDAVIDLRAVIRQNHHDVNIDDLHKLLKPAKGRYGLPDTTHAPIDCAQSKTNYPKIVAEAISVPSRNDGPSRYLFCPSSLQATSGLVGSS